MYYCYRCHHSHSPSLALAIFLIIPLSLARSLFQVSEPLWNFVHDSVNVQTVGSLHFRQVGNVAHVAKQESVDDDVDFLSLFCDAAPMLQDEQPASDDLSEEAQILSESPANALADLEALILGCVQDSGEVETQGLFRSVRVTIEFA